jgi:hypothetical protein
MSNSNSSWVRTEKLDSASALYPNGANQIMCVTRNKTNSKFKKNTRLKSLLKKNDYNG